MPGRNIEIHVNARGLGTIHLDGEKLTGIRGFTITNKAGQRPAVTLDLVILDTDYFAEADVFVHEKAHASLLRLGWTPPPADAREANAQLQATTDALTAAMQAHTA